jgi:hypothetical protein
VTALQLWVLPLAFDIPPPPSPSPGPGQVAANYGFAVYLVGGFFALGLLVLIMILLRQRPKSAR